MSTSSPRWPSGTTTTPWPTPATPKKSAEPAAWTRTAPAEPVSVGREVLSTAAGREALESLLRPKSPTDRTPRAF